MTLEVWNPSGGHETGEDNFELTENAHSWEREAGLGQKIPCRRLNAVNGKCVIGHGTVAVFQQACVVMTYEGGGHMQKAHR